ncbi:MAG: ATP-binding cassette domain-containing protein [Pseudomonadota bacterium]
MAADVLNRPEHLVTLDTAGSQREGRWLVRGVSMSLSPGEIVTLIGPNGAGKSTTAKMGLGILRPTEGSATRRSGLRLSYVPQKLSIDWTLPLTVGRFMRLTGGLSDADIETALTETAVAHLTRAQMQTLSGGEFQRVLLARAIARKPDLLVLDEPVQGVDFAGEVALYDLIQNIRDRRGCGILLISHNLHLVMAATDRVICLNGHVCCSGTPTAVASTTEYKRLFGARAASALAVYEHDHDHVHLSDGSIAKVDDHSAQ